MVKPSSPCQDPIGAGLTVASHCSFQTHVPHWSQVQIPPDGVPREGQTVRKPYMVHSFCHLRPSPMGGEVRPMYKSHIHSSLSSQHLSLALSDNNVPRCLEYPRNSLVLHSRTHKHKMSLNIEWLERTHKHKMSFCIRWLERM